MFQVTTKTPRTTQRWLWCQIVRALRKAINLYQSIAKHCRQVRWILMICRWIQSSARSVAQRSLWIQGIRRRGTLALKEDLYPRVSWLLEMQMPAWSFHRWLRACSRGRPHCRRSIWTPSGARGEGRRSRRGLWSSSVLMKYNTSLAMQAWCAYNSSKRWNLRGYSRAKPAVPWKI